MNSNKLIKSALQRGEQVLSLLTEEDRERILEWRDASIEQQTGKTPTLQPKIEFGSGCGIFFLLTSLFIGLFALEAYNNRQGCRLPHREKIRWETYCGENPRKYHDLGCLRESDENYRARLGNYLCTSYQKDHSEMKCVFKPIENETY